MSRPPDEGRMGRRSLAIPLDGGAVQRGLLGRRALIEGALASLALPFLSACGDDGAAEPGQPDGGSLDDIMLGRDAGMPPELPDGARAYLDAAERAAIIAIGQARGDGLDGDAGPLEETLAAIETLDPDALRQRVADDFAAGRSVLVAGWVLSRTEADLCALFALLEIG